MQNTIKYSGLKNLNPIEQQIINQILEREYPRIQRMIKNESDLHVHIKTVKKDTRKRYIISIRLEAATKMYSTKTKDTEEAGDWDIKKATHKAIEHLESEIKRSIKPDEGKWKKSKLRKILEKI